MIFITLGSQKFQFNRLLKKVDELIENNIINEDVVAQIGYSDYKPQNYSYKDFLNQEEFKEKMAKADLIITHAGTGAIITALKQQKKVIAVPRLAKYGEHVDDHQLQIVESFTKTNLILGVNEINELERKIKDVKNHQFNIFQSNNENFLKIIEHDILE